MREEPVSGMDVSRVAVSVIVLTFNEERNIVACLDSVRDWASAVFVVDSASSDRTVELAAAAGAVVVPHAFETHARQWAWAMANLPIGTGWVLALDADQRVTPELRDAVREVVDAADSVSPTGYYLNRRQVFRGRWIRHGGYYPKYLLKLFRRDAVSIDERDLVDHHFSVSGPTGTLRGDLIEQNLNEDEIRVWIDKHNRYARLQALQELESGGPDGGALFGTPDDRVRWMKRWWRRLPLFVRPALYFVYRYVLRLGFLDGREGFLFHVLQAFWYRLLVDINISEIRQQRDGARRSAP
jgi:glycosyltransferase involved in cell wall biosynthesis